jgi:hypothetical protein
MEGRVRVIPIKARVRYVFCHNVGEGGVRGFVSEESEKESVCGAIAEPSDTLLSVGKRVEGAREIPVETEGEFSSMVYR